MEYTYPLTPKFLQYLKDNHSQYLDGDLLKEKMSSDELKAYFEVNKTYERETGPVIEEKRIISDYFCLFKFKPSWRWPVPIGEWVKTSYKDKTLEGLKKKIKIADQEDLETEVLVESFTSKTFFY